MAKGAAILWRPLSTINPREIFEMKPMRIFGLAAVVAMALLGAGSASGSPNGVICYLGGSVSGECPSGSAPFTGKVLGTSLGGDTFSSSFVTVKCEGDMHGEVTNAGSATTRPLGSITQVLWSGCTNNIGCTTTTAVAEATPWGVSALAIGLEGILHISGVKGSFTLSDRKSVV